MTQKPKNPYSVYEPDVVKLGSEADRQPAAPGINAGTRDSQESNPSGPPAPKPGYLPLHDRIGQQVRLLSEMEWRLLHERGKLIELVFGRRQRLIACRLLNGVAVAHINQALRVGIRDRLPILPPNVIRVMDGGVVYYEHHKRRCEAYGHLVGDEDGNT